MGGKTAQYFYEHLFCFIKFYVTNCRFTFEISTIPSLSIGTRGLIQTSGTS
uniref:Uncharacterized protein n=1 Tax=Picea sitchensis TaxID=3332 RepID=A9NRE8_PICSI|nr:unknown [Picea sitchensis]